ncbi:hypothetical protein [Alcaligenes sp. Me129]
MIKNLCAVVGFAMIAHYSYQHYLQYQRLKAENALLRQRWKECADTKPN